MEQEVPIAEKALLTIREAADYYNLGLHKLRELTNDEHCPFVLWNGNIDGSFLFAPAAVFCGYRSGENCLSVNRKLCPNGLAAVVITVDHGVRKHKSFP